MRENSGRPTPVDPWDDQKMEAIMGTLLRVGVLLSAVVVTLGGVLYLVRYGAAPPHHTVFHGEPADLTSIPAIVTGAARGTSRGIIQLGLLLLIATPIARVVFAAYAFAREKDRMYVVISLIVLATLLYGLISAYV